MANVLPGDPVSPLRNDIPQKSRPPTSSTSPIPPPSPSPEWDSDTVSLKEFPTRKVVPGFAKIVKGNYMNLGPSKFSFQRQHLEVFIHSVKVSVKVLAHCLRRIETSAAVSKQSRRGSSGAGNSAQSVVTRVYAVDQRLAIPISYQGWFELLSEDGKSARPITSVHELSKVNPDKVLVRENIKGYIQNEDGKMLFDSSKIVLAGEQLILCGELTIPTQAENKKVKLLRCFDSKGDQVFLSFDQKGMFTPIAGENDFTGVFSIRDVIRRFRLPLTVKLIQGVRPKVDPSKFTGLIRLDWVYSDETAFVCPIERNHVRLLPIPTDTPLQFVSAINQGAMKSTQLYNTMWLKCNRMISNYNNTIHLIVNLPDAIKGKSKPNSNIFSAPFETDTSRPRTTKAKVKEDKLMDEIDNLYGYVREGGAPPSGPKFQYDSDEESYFEEPAYEPLDDFRARLRALEAGEKVTHHSKYKPQDVSKLVFETDPDKIDDENPYGVINGGSDNKKPPQRAPPLPPRPIDMSKTPSGSPSNSTKSPPKEPTSETTVTVSGAKHDSSKHEDLPPIPPRKNSQPEKYVTTVSANSGWVSSNRTSAKEIQQTSHGVELFSAASPPRPPGILNRRMSYESINSASGSSNGNRHGKLFARDFRDSDISSVTKRSSGSSSGAKKPTARKKMQTLYL